MEDQAFTPIRHYEGIYEINPFGHVRTVARRTSTGQGARVLKARFLGSWPNKTGMRRIHLKAIPSDGTIQPKCRMVHSLVAETFLPPAPGPIGRKYYEYRIIHVDGDKNNNHFSNIKYIKNLPENRHDSSKKHNEPVEYVELNAIDTYLDQLALLDMDSIHPVPSVLVEPIKEDTRNSFDLSQALGVDVWVIQRIRRGTPREDDIGTWHPLNLTLSKS